MAAIARDPGLSHPTVDDRPDSRSGRTSGPAAVPRPRHSPLSTFEMAWIAGLDVGAVAALWLRHGRLEADRDL